MSTTSNPKVSISLLPASLATSIVGRSDLICGTIPSAGTATPGQLYTDVGKLTKIELDTLFVANSDIRNRIQQFLDSNGGYSTLNVKVVSESAAPASVQAVGTITFGTGAGTATEDGELIVSVVDKAQYKVTVAVTTGDTDQDVVDNIVAALSSANFPSMPMVVTENGVNDYQVDFTAVDGGTIGNNYNLEISGVVAGLGTIVLVQPASGANDAVVTDFFDNLQSSRFTGINWPSAWEAQVNVVKSYLDSRFNASNAILDGVAFLGKHGTFATVKAAVDAQNSQSLVYIGGQEFSGTDVAVFQPADWIASYFQGIRSRRLTEDAPIADFITTTSGVLDAFGGVALASLPYMNSPLYNLDLANPNELYSNQEQVELEDAGYSVVGVNSAENLMLSGVIVTTYTTDVGGNPNNSFKYLNYVDTASICREYMFNNLKSRFSQSRLTTGTLVVGRSIENEQSIRAEFVKLYKQLSLEALTIAGSVAEKFFNKNLVVTLDLPNRKVTASMQLPIVTQLGEMVVAVQLNFNVEGA